MLATLLYNTGIQYLCDMPELEWKQSKQNL